MCTLTWFYREDGSYHLLFNRDELKTRQRAEPPRLHVAENGMEYLAPIDADAGGTWLAVNSAGVTVCLLNDYRAPDPEIAADQIHSRGEVVAKIAGCSDADEAFSLLSDMPLAHYRGFRLVVFCGKVRKWRWDTRELVELGDEVIRNPITSSSYDEVNVQRTRAAFFDSLEGPTNLDKLQFFHSAHIDDDLCEVSGEAVAVSSVCMHRQYAETVSQCEVGVDGDAVSIAYTDGAPCKTAAGAPVLLPRANRRDRAEARFDNVASTKSNQF